MGGILGSVFVSVFLLKMTSGRFDLIVILFLLVIGIHFQMILDK